MAELHVRRADFDSLGRVADDNPLPVAIVENRSNFRLATFRIAVPRSSGTTAYAANDAFGGTWQIPGACLPGKGGYIESVTIIDLSGQKAAANIYLFDSAITATADNSAFAVADADFLRGVAWIAVASTDYQDSSAAAIATKLESQPFSISGTTLYGQMETTGTPTMAATNDDLYLQFVIRQLL